MTACGLSAVAAGWLVAGVAPAGLPDAGDPRVRGRGAPVEEGAAASSPVYLRGPAGLRAAVVPVAAHADGALALPGDLRTGGWWALGAQVGAAHGTVLIAGHVDNRADGPGPFAALHRAPVGARVEVTGADGGIRPYRVTARRTYPRRDLPADLFTRTGPHRLALLTCAGPYDRSAGRYRNNLVVYAVPAGTP